MQADQLPDPLDTANHVTPDARGELFARFFQDPLRRSKRAWSALLGLATAILAMPEVQALILAHLGTYSGEWAPVATAAASAVLAGWSKAADPRPRRTIGK